MSTTNTTLHTRGIISLFSQYAATFAAVSTGTAYAVWKRPPNGIAIMLVAGAGGSLLDLAYGWNVSCATQVDMWRRHQEQLEREKES
jgi:multidrug transporter EmrE-like cation transporter